MDGQGLRKLLEETDDKLSIFATRDTFKKYIISLSELLDLIKDFLNDEEKLKLFNYSHFQRFSAVIKEGIIKLVSDENILLQMLNNDNIMNDFKDYQIINLLNDLSDNVKESILNNQEFLQKHQINFNQLKEIVMSVSDAGKEKILQEKSLLIDKLHFDNWTIGEIIQTLPEDKTKSKMIKIYQLKGSIKNSIIKKFSLENKINMLLEDESLEKGDQLNILSSFDMESLTEFLVQHKEFCNTKNISPYEIEIYLKNEQKIEFVKRLLNKDLPVNEKRETLAILPSELKQEIDVTNLPEEYRAALSIEKKENNDQRIVVDLERNLKDYQGLDNLISINPENFTQEQRNRFIKLCDICHNLQVINDLYENVEYYSTGREYKEAEEWIDEVIKKLKPEYSKLQKIAVIDNEIGKKISYSPDFDTEIFDRGDCRALWKIISTGYGVCNGIAKVEKYIFDRLEIESEMVSSDIHTFLKIKNIEFVSKNGEILKGNTILDPTWNLVAHRFGGVPCSFCIDYEQARKIDFDNDGNDLQCHKNDEELQDATLSLEEENLRKLFKSVGLTEREDKFPIGDLIDKSEEIDKLNKNNMEENIKQQFILLSQICPEFAQCQNSSMDIISNILLDHENLKFNRCVVKRVYKKADKEKRPVIFVYIDSNEIGKKFYFADKNIGQFVELPEKEFIEQFECYEEDIKRNNGLKLWENRDQNEKTEKIGNSINTFDEEGVER